MPKTTLLLLALAGLALAAPLAQAQHQMSVALALDPPEGPLSHDNATTSVGTTTITADFLAAFSNGVTLQYTVSRQPAWLTVVVSPSTDVVTFSPQPGSASMTIPRTFAVTMSVAPNVTEDAIDTVEISVTATPSTPGGAAKSARASMPVRVLAGEPCGDHKDGNGKGNGSVDEAEPATAARADDAPTLDAAAPALTPREADPVTIQQASAPIAPASYLAVGGFAAAGAGAGFLLRRRGA